ncbi:flagellar export chaperone FliS [Aliidiomarina quisquiliarum]|uniref:flagellar export chaperone FliS n=1 Tax=Aliidiomarina quisquiliarum TaxID=2938947 RepID=UPI00208E0889|nr:flagellar export chaperone FliS [Aliidiomarina quisquiliarum]MCO4321657.1 flagellar export chaperone FliS [Aliidiomarina quisquiliarum]
MYNKGLKAYNSVGVSNQAAMADPYRVIQMLLQGALDKMAYAKGAIERKDHAEKAKHLTKSVAIVSALQGALDMDVKADVTNNLFDLYSFIMDQLTDVSIDNDVEKLDQTMFVIRQIKEGWDAIPVSAREEGLRLQAQRQTARA